MEADDIRTTRMSNIRSQTFTSAVCSSVTDLCKKILITCSTLFLDIIIMYSMLQQRYNIQSKILNLVHSQINVKIKVTNKQKIFPISEKCYTLSLFNVKYCLHYLKFKTHTLSSMHTACKWTCNPILNNRNCK